MPGSYTIKNHIPQTFYTEGPAIDKEGNIFFTTLSGGAIIKRSASGEQMIWAMTACPNGQFILENGHHLVCDSQLASIIHFDEEGNPIESLLNGFCAGEKISVPNDLITDSRGNIIFTDSIRFEGKIGFIGIDGREKIIVKGLDYPNGLALSKDKKKLYVAESYKNRIIAVDLEKLYNTGSKEQESLELLWEISLPENPSGHASGNLPDGIKVDENSNLWVAHYGMGMVHIYSPENMLMQSIRMPFSLTSNLFIKNKTVIITGGDGEPGPGAVVEIEFNS